MRKVASSEENKKKKKKEKKKKIKKKKKKRKINTERNTIYKTFRTLRKKSKNSYYLNLTDKYKY